MASGTYDPTDRAFYERAYDILVDLAGARSAYKDSFVLACTNVGLPLTEYSFQGKYGCRMKFHRVYGWFYVDCPEEESQDLEALQTASRINYLLYSLQQELNPKAMPEDVDLKNRLARGS